MAIQFHKLKVSKIKRETENAVSVYFDIPENLKEEFDYKPGQYVTLRFFFDGKDERRCYSICTSPVADEDMAVTVKKLEGGLVSPYINETLKEGDEVDVMPPLGNFTMDFDESNERSYILFGGGSGITPLMSILKTVLQVEPKSKILLVYANTNEDSIIFRDELIELDEKYERFNVIHQLSKPQDTLDIEWREGRIDENHCKSILNLLDSDLVKESEYFLCGPGGMMQEIESVLESFGIFKDKVHKESFTVAENQNKDIVASEDFKESTGNGEVDSVKVVLYGEEHELDLEEGETILMAGIRAGIDPPFSCQIGACSTCRAKLKSGKVEMDADDALTDDEMEEGFVLTCQSHPVSDDVVVDYDDNF